MLWNFGEKLEEWDGRIPDDPPAGDPLLYLLNQVGPRLSKDKQHELDDDPESLRKLLEREGGREKAALCQATPRTNRKLSE